MQSEVSLKQKTAFSPAFMTDTSLSAECYSEVLHCIQALDQVVTPCPNLTPTPLSNADLEISVDVSASCCPLQVTVWLEMPWRQIMESAGLRGHLSALT